MYVVVFEAELEDVDAKFHESVKRLQTRAFERYNCRKISSVTENNREITISLWDNEQDILDWKQDSEHSLAQVAGQQQWYRSYHVYICQSLRDYHR